MMDENILNEEALNEKANEQDMTGENCKSEPVMDENKIGENIVTEPVELNFEEFLSEEEGLESERVDTQEESKEDKEETWGKSSESEDAENREETLEVEAEPDLEVEENPEEVSGVKAEEESGVKAEEESGTESVETQDEPKLDEEEICGKASEPEEAEEPDSEDVETSEEVSEQECTETLAEEAESEDAENREEMLEAEAEEELDLEAEENPEEVSCEKDEEESEMESAETPEKQLELEEVGTLTEEPEVDEEICGKVSESEEAEEPDSEDVETSEEVSEQECTETLAEPQDSEGKKQKNDEKMVDMTQLEHVMPIPEISGNSQTNRLNVLLLALSTFPMSLKKNTYVTGENVHEEFDYFYQLEPIPQMLSNKLGKDGQFIDRVIILYTDDTKEETHKFINVDGEEIKHSPLSYFKERMRPWLNPNCTDLYYEIEINEDNPVKGVAQTVYYLRELKGDNKEVHLYMDEHGGFRSVQLVLQAITSLLKNEVTMEAVYGMKFNGPDNPGKIMDVTKTFRIFDFVSGINEFINYGRIDSLEHYYDDKLEDSSEIGTRLDGMKRIASGLQLCDTKEYEDGLRIMQKEMETAHENGQKNDEYLDLFEQTIKYDYGNLLGNRRDTEFVLDTVEWCAKKGFLQQALTYIEDKMPKYFLEKEIIRIKTSGADLNNIEVAKKVKKSLGAQPYVTMDNAKFYSLIIQIKKLEMNKYYRECVYEIVKGYVAPQNLDYKKWLSLEEHKDVYEKVWLNLLNLNEKNKLSKKIDALRKKSVNYMNQLTFKGLLESCKEWEKEKQKNNIISDAIAACIFDENNHFVHFKKNILLEEKEEVFFNKVNNNCKNVSGLIASNKKSLKTLLTMWIDIRNILKNRADNEINESDKNYILTIINYILTYRDNKNDYAFLNMFNEDEIEKAFINTICDLLLIENDTKENETKEQLYQMLNYPKNNFSNLKLLEKLMNKYVTDLNWTPTKEIKQLLSYDEDKLNDLYKQLIDAYEKTCEKKDIIEKYIVYRMKECDFEKTGKYVAKVADPKFMEQYLYNKNTGKGFNVSHSLMINGLSSETWASLENEYKYVIKDKDYKSVKFTITIPTKIDRQKLQDVLLLHAALKQERNNSNHASEKGERVPAKIVKYMILQYVDMCRQLK